MRFQISNKTNKKYMVRTPCGRIVHFGDKRYQHYEDVTGLGLYSYLDHKDKKRRCNFMKRMKAIKKKADNSFFYKDKESALYYSLNFLW